jgi:hypothetical protein
VPGCELDDRFEIGVELIADGGQEGGSRRVGEGCYENRIAIGRLLEQIGSCWARDPSGLVLNDDPPAFAF